MRRGELLAVLPLHIVDDMGAVLAAVQAHRHEPRLRSHELGALFHQVEHFGLVVRRHFDRGDLGDDVAVGADLGHGVLLSRVREGNAVRGVGFRASQAAGSAWRAAIAAWIATVRRAMSACRRSTMRPSSCTTPLSLFSGRSKAAMIFFAWATSSSLGEKAALQGSIWRGWMRVLPSKPLSPASAHSRAKPCASARSLKTPSRISRPKARPAAMQPISHGSMAKRPGVIRARVSLARSLVPITKAASRVSTSAAAAAISRALSMASGVSIIAHTRIL